MKTIVASLALLILSSFSALAFSQTVSRELLWADLNDIAVYAPKAMPEAAEIAQTLKNDPRYLKGGAKFKFGIHLDAEPADLTEGNILYRASALMADKTGRLFYRKFAIVVNPSQKPAVKDVQIVEDVDLSKMHFQVNAGLLDRMVVVEDFQHEVSLVFPLGVGGFDENVTGHGVRVLTPQFHNAWLKRATVIPTRRAPAYYRGMPFMPITNAAGMRTPIAFHVTILSDSDWNTKGGNYLVRGFESHGCMRMRQKDLMEFFTIVMKAGDKQLPVNVDYFVWNTDANGQRQESLGQVSSIHPYPVVGANYMTIQNFGTAKRPVAKRDDEEHLLIMDEVNHAPDLSHLSGFSADDLTSWKEFAGLTTDLAGVL